MFILSPYNSLRFAKRDNLLPNYTNQLHSERSQSGLKTLGYCQLIENGDEVTIQIRSDFDGAITAVLIDNSDNSESSLTVTSKAVYTDFTTYEFDNTFTVNGNYSIRVEGVDSVQDNVEYLSEPIFVDTEHKDTLYIKYYNETNTEFVDYSTGITHFMRVPSRIPDAEHETDSNTYDNQNRTEKTYAATKFRADFTTGAIPEYLVRQITLAQDLFMFFINDIQYVSEEEPSSERFGQSTLQQLTLVCTEYEVAGVNDDDSTATTTPETTDDMNTYPLNTTLSASGQLTVPAGFMIDALVFNLASGSSATIKTGLTVSGDEVLTEKTLTTSSPTKVYDREYLGGSAQYESAFNVYFTVTGVSISINVNMIVKKYITL